MADEPAYTSVIPSHEVMGELIVLRQQDGLTMRRVRDHGPRLCALRITTDQLQRRRLDESDRHVAAYEVVQCAVNSLVPRSDFSRVLAKTLNLAGDEGTLGRRRDRLRSELYISEKAYKRLEEEAYVHLAGALVAAERSPCAGLPSDHLAEIAFDLRITTTAEQLLKVLTLLSFERRETVRNLLGDALMEVLPNARAALDDYTLAQLEGPWALARHVIGAVLMNAWPPNPKVTAPDEVLLSAGSLSNALLSNVHDVDLNYLLTARDEQERLHDQVMVTGDQPSAEFFKLKGDTMVKLANQIREIEQNDKWSDVLPPVGAGESIQTAPSL